MDARVLILAAVALGGAARAETDTLATADTTMVSAPAADSVDSANGADSGYAARGAGENDSGSSDGTGGVAAGSPAEAGADSVSDSVTTASAPDEAQAAGTSERAPVDAAAGSDAAADTSAAPPSDDPFGGYGEGTPFGGGGEGGGTGGLSPFAAATHTREASAVKLDLARAMTFSSVDMLPDNIETSSETGFAWSIGVRVPLRSWLQAGVALRYQHVVFGAECTEMLPAWPSPVDTADTTAAELPSPSVTVDAREELRFLSVPIDIDVRFTVGRVSPYVYGVVEPALFISGNYLAHEKTTAVFEDEAVLTWEKTYDRDVSDDRETYHVFLGGGIGIEYEYGYGSFYLSGGCMVALTDMGTTNTMPARTSSTLITFPVTFGLRFGI